MQIFISFDLNCGKIKLTNFVSRRSLDGCDGTAGDSLIDFKNRKDKCDSFTKDFSNKSFLRLIARFYR